MKLPSISTRAYYPADVQERIAAFNAEAVAVEAEQQVNDARLVELRDPASITAANAGERVKQIAKGRVERLALLARVRALAVEAAAILGECQPANNAELLRLTDASRARQVAIREGLAALNITEELACRRAFIGDAELHKFQGDASAVGQGHPQQVERFRGLLVETDAAIVAMLSA